MKKITGILLIVLLAMTPGFAQQKNIDAVIIALRAGSASELSKYFDDNVELTLPDKSDSYSKAQAQLIIRDFFGNNGVKGFELKHKGDSPGGQFCVGTLQTGTGSFRTTLFMKIKGGKEVVKEIRFQAIE